MSRPEAGAPPRQTGIDLLESIAILLVLVYHTGLYSWDIFQPPGGLHAARYWFQTLLSPCVPLFFFANGFLLLNRAFDWGKHIRRTLHLILLCAVWGAGKLLLLMPIKGEFLSARELLQALWEWRPGWINSLWFLGTLVCLYIVFPLLKTAFDHNRGAFLWFTAVCALCTFGNTLLNEAATLFLTRVLHRSTTTQTFNFFNMFNPFQGANAYALVYFCAGGCLYRLRDRLARISPRRRSAAAVLVMAASCTGLWALGICYSLPSGRMWDVVWNGYDTVFTFVNVICIFVLCLNLKKEIAAIRTISCNTMGIYLTHELFIELTRPAALRCPFLCTVPGGILYALAILLVSLAAALLLGRIPVVRRLVH